jgi:hypothetical protein
VPVKEGFFFERKNPKTFAPGRTGRRRRAEIKSLFASFSSEKEESSFR